MWYESKYFIDTIEIVDIDKDKTKLIDWNFNLKNIIGIRNFILKNNINFNVDKSQLPELIFEDKNLCKKIYLLEQNKYGKPIGNITIIRKNNYLLDKENKFILGIYIELCEKILNYFLEIMSDYKLSFSMSISREYLIYNFYGLDYKLDYFISQIMGQIHPETIIYNKNTKKYFSEIIRDIKESITNFKYNSPYVICSKYLSYLLDNNLLPDEKMKFISELTFEKFTNKINLCLKYSKEYYILIGIKKYGFGLNLNTNLDYVYTDDQYMTQLIDLISLNPKKYLMDITTEKQIESKIDFENYNIESKHINPNEINNCLIKYWCIKNIKIKNNNEKFDIDFSKKIIKERLVCSIVSEMLNEPLFDKVRTIDKLGYIVKSDYKTIINLNEIYYITLFLIQSSYSIKKISNSIIEFNEYLSLDIKSNYENYLEKFRLLKESKLIEFNKPFSDLAEEINIYIEAIISNIFDFNLNKLFYDVCKDIDFSKDIEPIISMINNSDSKNYNIILEKNKKN